LTPQFTKNINTTQVEKIKFYSRSLITSIIPNFVL